MAWEIESYHFEKGGVKMKKIYGLIATVSTVIAALLASSACYLFMYQPAEPDSLRDR